MKTIFKIGAALIITSACITLTPARTSAQQVQVSLQLFYDNLSPYGQWSNSPQYGYVWKPNVHKGFSPYGSDGHWIFTEDGWTWVSDYPWGWAPFHYGRWDYDPYDGWLWIPDIEWAPAWVSWRRSEGYYGWAPMGPGINVNIAIGREYKVPNDRWIFVKDRDIDRPDVNRYYVNKTNNVTIINKSTVIVNTHVDNRRNVTYIAGPDREEVQKYTGKPVKPYAVKEMDKPEVKVNNNELHVYRPQVQKVNKDGKAPAPAKVVPLKKDKHTNAKKPN